MMRSVGKWGIPQYDSGSDNYDNISEENTIKRKEDFKSLIKEKYDSDIKESSLENIKIVAYTSISPGHKNMHNQLFAVESWRKLGIEVYSLNNSKEISALKDIYPAWIKFVPSEDTTEHIFGKPCIMINSMMDHFVRNKTGDILMLINSDIILDTSKELISKIKSASDSCIPISHRNDYDGELKPGNKYAFGFDVFFINKKHISIFPKSMYSMGQTWWDYWIPYVAIKNKTTIFIIQEKIAFHKQHAIQYGASDWIKMTDFFRWENNIREGNHQLVNDTVRNNIINNSISFPL